MKALLAPCSPPGWTGGPMPSDREQAMEEARRIQACGLREVADALLEWKAQGVECAAARILEIGSSACGRTQGLTACCDDIAQMVGECAAQLRAQKVGH